MDIKNIVAQLEEERDRLTKAIGALKGLDLTANHRKIIETGHARAGHRIGVRGVPLGDSPNDFADTSTKP